MNKHLRTLPVAFALFAASLCSLAARTVTSFDADWRFLKADAPGAAAVITLFNARGGTRKGRI